MAFLPPKSRPGNNRRRTPQQRQVCPKQSARLRPHGSESDKRHCKLPGSPPLTWDCYRTAALSQLHLHSCGSRRRKGSSQTTAHGLQPWGSVLPESCTVPWSTTKTKNTQNWQQHHSEPIRAGIYKGGSLAEGQWVPCTLQPPTVSCCLMSSVAPTPTPDHQISSLLTLLIPHSVPSKRGTRSRVQLDLSPGCTWHDRTSHMSWCVKKIREFGESLRLINTAVPKAAPFKWSMMFGFPTATQQCKQVPSFLLLLGKSCGHVKRPSLPAVMLEDGQLKQLKVPPTLGLPH